MQAGVKHYNYYSTMLKYTDFFDFLKKERVDENVIHVITMLWSAYAVDKLLNSAYFESLRVGDGWYSMTVQKYVNDTYSVKIKLNPNYANVLERFTK